MVFKTIGGNVQATHEPGVWPHGDPRGPLPQTEAFLCFSSDLSLKETGNETPSSGHGYSGLTQLPVQAGDANVNKMSPQLLLPGL